MSNPDEWTNGSEVGFDISADMELDVTRTILYGICIPVIVLLCILAAVLNLAVFASRFYVKSRTTSLELTYSLSLSDTWTSTVIALSLFWNSYKTVILGMQHSSFCFSLTMEIFRTGGLLTGVFHLAALAFIHYLQIVRPFDHARLLSLRQCHAIIVLIWTLPPFALMIFFASWEGQGYRIINCVPLYVYDSIWFRSQIAFIIFSLMLTTCIVYWRLLRVVDKVRMKTGAPSPATPALQSNGRGRAASRRTVITATLIFGTFIFGWAPACILYVLTATGMPLNNDKSLWVNVLSVVVLLNIMIKTLTNPIIYATRIPEIRNFVLNRMLYKITGKTSAESEREATSIAARRRSEFTQQRSKTLNINTMLTTDSSSFIDKLERSSINRVDV